jgi:hypothetical protein
MNLEDAVNKIKKGCDERLTVDEGKYAGKENINVNIQTVSTTNGETGYVLAKRLSQYASQEQKEVVVQVQESGEKTMSSLFDESTDVFDETVCATAEEAQSWLKETGYVQRLEDTRTVDNVEQFIAELCEKPVVNR